MSISYSVALGAEELLLHDEALTEGMFVVPGKEDGTPGKQTVNRWGVCWVIGNDDPSGQLVPTKDEREWSLGSDSYLKNTATMPWISLQGCDEAYPPEVVTVVTDPPDIPESMEVYPLGSCGGCHIGMEDPRLMDEVVEEVLKEVDLDEFMFPPTKFIDVDGAAPCPSDESPYTWIVYCDIP
jgi:hypothetical protein